MDAIRRLPPCHLKARRKKIDMVVIRVNANGLQNSMPCFMCINHMDRINKQTNYTFKHVIYSNDKGGITYCKFDELLNSKNKHVSLRFKKIN